MTHPIEIKANIDGHVASALQALGDLGAASLRQIWFADRGADQPDSPTLSSLGVIVRLRSGEEDDLTVKLRPCEDAQLVGRWSTSFDSDELEYRIEGDWSGAHHMLAASAVTTARPGSLATIAAGGNVAVGDAQRDFLRSCGPAGVGLEGLNALGPIASMKWTDVDLGGIGVNVERWTVLDLDFLELSIRITPHHDDATAIAARATRRQADLLTAIGNKGLTVASNAENKTQRVLAALAAAQPGAHR